MATVSTGSTFSKKHIALLLSIPATIVVGYYIYKKKISCNRENNSDQEEKTEETAEDIQEKKKKDLEEALLNKEKGNQCYRNGKYDDAIKYYDKAIEKCPKDYKGDLAIFYQNRAASYEMLQRWQQVRADCTKALELNPKYPKPYTRRSKANQHLGNLYECLDDLTACCILESFQNKKAIEDVDLLLRNIAEKEAMELIKHRAPELPSKHFIKSFMDSFIMDPIVKMNLPTQEGEPKGFVRAKLALDAENYEDILPACNEEINSDDEGAVYKHEALLLRGTMYTLMGLLERAEEDLNNLINNDNVRTHLYVYAHLRRAMVKVFLYDDDSWLLDCQEAERNFFKCVDIYLVPAELYLKRKQLEKALEYYRKVLDVYPQHGIARLKKNYIEYRQEALAQRHPPGLVFFNNVKNMNRSYPTIIEGYKIMVQILLELGDYLEAANVTYSAIYEASHDISLYVLRDFLLLHWHGDTDYAMQCFDFYVSLPEPSFDAYKYMGLVFITLGQPQTALNILNDAWLAATNFTDLTNLCALRLRAVCQQNLMRAMGFDDIDAGIIPWIKPWIVDYN